MPFTVDLVLLLLKSLLPHKVVSTLVLYPKLVNA